MDRKQKAPRGGLEDVRWTAVRWTAVGSTTVGWMRWIELRAFTAVGSTVHNALQPASRCLPCAQQRRAPVSNCANERVVEVRFWWRLDTHQTANHTRKKGTCDGDDKDQCNRCHGGCGPKGPFAEASVASQQQLEASDHEQRYCNVNDFFRAYPESQNKNKDGDC